MDPLSLLGRAVAVFVLLGITLWLVRRTDGLKKLRRSQTPLEVLGSARLGKGASVALVRIGDADYALGVTDQAVSLLTEAELGDEAEAVEDDAPARPGLPAALQAQLGLLTRRGHGSRLDRAPEAGTPAAAPAPAAVPAVEEAAPGPDTDDDFAALLAAATAPVGPVEDAVPQPAPLPLSARLKEAVEAAEAAVDASADAAPRTAPAPERSARTTGARGARGPRARAAAGDVPAAVPAAVRTGQRRAVRTRTARQDTSAAA